MVLHLCLLRKVGRIVLKLGTPAVYGDKFRHFITKTELICSIDQSRFVTLFSIFCRTKLNYYSIVRECTTDVASPFCDVIGGL